MNQIGVCARYFT